MSETMTKPVMQAAARPRTLSWAVPAVLGWGVLYGILRSYWAMGNAPTFAPMPNDLLLFSGWGVVGLCVAAMAAAAGLWLTRSSWAALVAAWGVVAAIVAACPMLLLDTVGGVLVGLGIPLNVVSAAARLGAFAGAVLLGLAALSYQRRMRGGCQRCGRIHSAERSERTPVWAWWAAYIAVAGCVVRVAAQYVVGFDGFVYEAGIALIVFDAGFLLAGILLPTALVHRFGRIWPRWVLPLAGRAVPRWLVLGPAFFIGGGLTVYFGIGTVDLIVDTINGKYSGDGVMGLAFMWTAVPAYLVWGLGIGVASIARFTATRPSCKTCGR